MIDEDARELADLRRRAYGPDADIHADPPALARLSELERMREAERGRRDAPAAEPAVSAAELTASAATATAVPAAAVPAEPAAPADAPALDPAVVDPASVDPAPRPPRVLRSPRRLWTPWAASLVVVAVASAWAATAIAGASSAPDATLHAVHTPTAAATENDAYGLQQLRYFEPFHGLTAISGRSNGQPCLLIVVDASDENGPFGPFAGGCGAGPFPPVADILLEREQSVVPQQTIDELGDGTALRFTLDGDVVRVYVGRSAAPSGGPGSGV